MTLGGVGHAKLSVKRRPPSLCASLCPSLPPVPALTFLWEVFNRSRLRDKRQSTFQSVAVVSWVCREDLGFIQDLLLNSDRNSAGSQKYIAGVDESPYQPTDSNVHLPSPPLHISPPSCPDVDKCSLTSLI
ncbi:hypothetical protein EYF80_014577 [Liparis tanakae]|uniref:Uncharacterized protein n=1 Tax=Liparis tanakae TaxID=230148 RepID=A0A4Z2IB27_9TELE|nr:hypothetical protein EYF80_014577 [Liparis tanakae]